MTTQHVDRDDRVRLLDSIYMINAGFVERYFALFVAQKFLANVSVLQIWEMVWAGDVMREEEKRMKGKKIHLKC